MKVTILSIEDIHDVVCSYFKVYKRFPFVDSRKRKYLYVRQVFHYVSSKNTNKRLVTLEDIGDYSKKINVSYNHATVLNSCKKIEGYLTYDKDVIRDIENIQMIIDKKTLKSA